MGGDGAAADEEGVGDLLVGLPHGDQPQDLSLARCQSGSTAAGALGSRPCDRCQPLAPALRRRRRSMRHGLARRPGLDEADSLSAARTTRDARSKCVRSGSANG